MPNAVFPWTSMRNSSWSFWRRSYSPPAMPGGIGRIPLSRRPTMDFTDQPAAIRKGEEIDPTRLEAFLRGTIAGLDGPMALQQFPRGHSNLTYHVRCGERELVLRRPPHGTKAKSAHDMGREYRILNALKDVYPYCPRPLAYTE